MQIPLHRADSLLYIVESTQSYPVLVLMNQDGTVNRRKARSDVMRLGDAALQEWIERVN